MKTRLLYLWDTLQTSYWFVPTIMTIMSVLLSVVTLSLEQEVKYKWAEDVAIIWAGGPEGARQVLSTIAGSMITVAGVVFSITIVALTLASSQFGPRLLRNFMADKGNQIVLGTFVSTFLYCLLILRSVQGMEEHTFVPYLSVTCGLVMALLSLGVLIYFIHHVSDSIQAENLIATVGHEFLHAIDEMFPEKIGQSGSPQEAEPVLPENMEDEAAGIQSHVNGYLQSVNSEALIKVASENDLIISIKHRPGYFISKGAVLVKVWPPDLCTEEIAKEIRHTFITNSHRTPTQDVAYPINQLVEVALRALSPSINDPFTAVTCIDWLGTGLSQISERYIPTRYRFDQEHRLRLIADPFTFPDLASLAFDPIRIYGKSNPMIIKSLFDLIKLLAPRIHRKEDKEILQKLANELHKDSLSALENTDDKQNSTLCFNETMALLHKKYNQNKDFK